MGDTFLTLNYVHLFFVLGRGEAEEVGESSQDLLLCVREGV